MTTTLRIKEPRELLAYLPHHLGFQPESSLVAISLRGSRRQLGLVVRVDLADISDPVLGPTQLSRLVGHLVHDGADEAMLVAYCEPEVGEQQSVRDAVPAEVAAAFAEFSQACDGIVGIVDRWVVTPEAYFSWNCQDDQCCPPQGKPTTDFSQTVVAANAVYSGSAIAARRDDLVPVQRASAADRRAAQRAARHWRERERRLGTMQWRNEGVDLWLKVANRDVETLTPTLIGRLHGAMSDIRVRDAVMLAALPNSDSLPRRCVAGNCNEEVGAALDAVLDDRIGVRPGDQAAAIGEALEAVTAHGPINALAPAWTVLAWLAWWSGNGARAWLLIDRAIAADDQYRLANLVATALEAGFPPGWVRKSR